MSDGLIIAAITLAITAPPAWLTARTAIRRDRRDAAESLERRVREQVTLETEVRGLREEQARRRDGGGDRA